MATSTLSPAAAVETRPPGALARRLTTAGRLLLGLLFLVMGLNGFLNFIPQPATGIPEGALAFGGALKATGYMFPLIKGTEVLVGLLLLSNRFVPLALVLLAPVVVNIVAFHSFLAPDGAVMAFVILAVHLLLAWSYRGAYRPLLTPRAQPGA
jgi:uncharacterized membrane protein YphA (DoxX/SURF4 family)